MLIHRVDVLKTELPFQAVSGAPFRTWQDGSPIIMVRLFAGDGYVGNGTATAIGFYLGLTAGAMLDLAVTLAPHLLGLSPFDIERAHKVMDRFVRGNQGAKAAFDIAMHDLMGQITGRPVYDLLGGRTQTEPIPTTTFALYISEPAKMAEDAAHWFAEGFRAFEIKMADPALDVARIKAIREAVGPEATLIADANGHWTVKEAVQLSRTLEPFDVMLEEPCHGVASQKEVRAMVPQAVIADETCHTLADAAEIARQRSADLVSIKIMKTGGLWPARQMASLIEAAGLGYRVDGVRGETLLSNTASVHLTTSLSRPVAPGLMQHRRLADDVVDQGGLRFADGRVSVDDQPGLGVSLKSDAGELVSRVEV